jgi:hypothetical protein
MISFMGAPNGMMWLAAKLCQQDTLNHGLSSQIVGLFGWFAIECWWSLNDIYTCSLSFNQS